jgi:hypothetical protein
MASLGGVAAGCIWCANNHRLNRLEESFPCVVNSLVGDFIMVRHFYGRVKMMRRTRKRGGADGGRGARETARRTRE